MKVTFHRLKIFKLLISLKEIFENMNLLFMMVRKKKIIQEKKLNLCHENESPLGHTIKMLKEKHFFSFT